MSERLPLSDNPSLETQVALVVQALGNFIEVTRNTLDRIERKLDITNGSVTTVTGRMNAHDLHHGPADIHIAERFEFYQSTLASVEKEVASLASQLAGITGEGHDSKVRRQLIASAIAVFVAGAAAIPVVYGAWLAIQEILGR